MVMPRLSLSGLVLAALCAMTLTACLPVIGPGHQVCAPGATQACACTSGREGAQTCSNDGTEWQTCICTTDRDAGTGGDGGPRSDAGTGGDRTPGRDLDGVGDRVVVDRGLAPDRGGWDGTPGSCRDRRDCAYGERCVSQRCVPGLDDRTCQDCSCADSASPCEALDQCLEGDQHLCLINVGYSPEDPSTAPRDYCVPRCATDDDCPRGLSCKDIAIVVICSQGEICSNKEPCRILSESTTGYCPCTSDLECHFAGAAEGCSEEGLCIMDRACAIDDDLFCADLGVDNP